MELKDIRTQIDAVDDQLVELFCERLRLAAAAGTAKWRQGLPLSDEAREREVIARVEQQAGPELAPYARLLFASLFAIAKDYQVQQAATDRWPGDGV